jgi:outer membrane protein TolC
MRDAAQARRDAAGFAAPFAVQASITDGPNFDPVSGNFQVDLSRELFTGARQSAARARADVELAAASAELAAVERSLDAEVVRAVARAVGATRIGRRLERSTRLLAESEEVIRARFAAGAARYLDVLRLRTERLQARADLSGAQAELASALARLQPLLAGGMDSAQLASVLDSTASDAAASGWAGLLAARVPPDSITALFPGVRLTAAEEARARAAIPELLAAQRSQVVGSAGVQRIGPANGGTSLGLALGITATLPFTARTSNAAGLYAAERVVAAAEAARAAALADARARMRAARARYAAAIDRLGAFDAALLAAAENERETAAAQYRAGTLPLLDLLDFERALQRVEIARSRAVIDAADALAVLHGLSPDGVERP